jgi:type IV secretion system protein VirD4
VPPSDISRTRPLVRLILNQVARRLTETLPEGRATSGPRLLLMLDEFPALGRLDFFETSLAFMAGYGVRAFLVAQSLHQIDRAYGANHAILDNCHVRVAFAPNDERTARRLSDALGTTTELRHHKNVSGKRLSLFLPHVSLAEQETPRPLLTAGEILQLPQDDALVLVSGTPPIRARKLRYYADRNFLSRLLPPPPLQWSACFTYGRLDRADTCHPRQAGAGMVGSHHDRHRAHARAGTSAGNRSRGASRAGSAGRGGRRPARYWHRARCPACP